MTPPREWIVTLLPHGVEPPAGAEVSPLTDCHHGRWQEMECRP